MIKFSTLFSGSSGNSAIIKSKHNTILIDAGVSAHRLELALKEQDSTISDINAIFITHEHIDHISALSVLSKKLCCPIYMTASSASYVERFVKNSYLLDIQYIEKDKEILLDDFVVTPFDTPHDSLDSVGYYIECENGKKIVYATDTGHITPQMLELYKAANLLAIEANHDIYMLKNGAYPYPLKKRVLSNFGHLSNDDCACAVLEAVANGCENVVLCHLSRENNLPILALKTVSNFISDNGIKNCDYNLQVAPPDCSSAVINV